MLRATEVNETSMWIDKHALRQAFSRRVVTRSLWVGLIVGTVLNVINQGSEFVEGAHINFVRLSLTFFVPFLVATYGAYSAFRHMDNIDRPRPQAND